MASLCGICGKPVPDYVPEYCCYGGTECGCQGSPLQPCCCSKECEDAVFNHIGLPFETRRLKSGIERYTRN